MMAFPPQRTYRAIPLSTSEAHTWLSAYLTSCESTAYLQPDALLTSSGPVQSQGMSSVTIHNLKRLHAGLVGKYDMTPVITDTQESAQTDKQFKSAVVNVDGLYAPEEDWQSKSEFEREQSVETGEVEDRDPSHGGLVESDAPNGHGAKKTKKGVQIVGKSNAKQARKNNQAGEAPVLDKKARKAAKKERRKQLKANARNRDEE